jgi:hypothetical protein
MVQTRCLFCGAPFEVGTEHSRIYVFADADWKSSLLVVPCPQCHRQNKGFMDFLAMVGLINRGVSVTPVEFVPDDIRRDRETADKQESILNALDWEPEPDLPDSPDVAA